MQADRRVDARSPSAVRAGRGGDPRSAPTGRTARRKLAALRAHASQTTGLRELVGEDTYLRWWSEESFVRVPTPLERAA